jgi:RHH-type proline utilization regulon transcriptional repressor/proline dehydrogenase/delta 1-pyrroline-5-carboxylate dehydrogenase
VGVQPFGGEGLSGTGPKVGGPHTLLRYATERSISVNIAAQGGDPKLLNL